MSECADGRDASASARTRRLEVFHRKHGEDALLSQEDLADEAQDGIDDDRADVYPEQRRRDAPNDLQKRLGGPERWPTGLSRVETTQNSNN